ncbi:hypothetical protein N7499_001389 [Penicillium canescens]|uniref:Leucine-rich repeat domain-containing protein n=1 Tax=Penicillium canescens TaxID=5083 RepID=A0AAD6N4E7_PENCN|nr:uncharacterized protein N7446_003471 [Penicillium canescens]KAJ6027928.1 hypothetical protein N7460_012745 [Penicillium canescens]KAJ6041214.1 hypothetical protein N7444_010119 [Penicillium canescens]KAJ6066434.1 hypothetical protein N7446_003471 [Penicillium canescens]KAJ6101759.1 hypothetical protein N7499_001389 [Penicillium canescens]KAJ6174223.1 hypothetical protein N7485_007035 [Penicillium canescens]
MELALPNDVLLLVGEQLEQKADSWNLVFVSRHFHDLFLSFVYRRVSLRNWNDASSFLHAILNRPVLARAVRELDLKDWHAKGLSEYQRKKITESTHLKEWIHVVSHSDTESQQWTEDLGQGLGDAWAALILPLLSQLRKLQLAYASTSPWLDRIMQRAIQCERPFVIQPPFKCLQEVSLHHRNDLDRDDTWGAREEHQSASALLMPFFSLPSVRVITANAVVDPSTAITSPEQMTQNLRVGFSSITEIDLRSSSGNHGMEALVSSCAALKSFKYQHSDSHVLSHGYQPSAFYRSLAHSKKSLQTLWLDHYGSHFPFTAGGLNQSHDEWFGSLADFTALRELRVRLPNLLDIRYQNEPSTPLLECLPSSLATLYIEGCEERNLGMLVSQLQIVIKNRRTRFPGLNRIDIEGAFQNVRSDDDGTTTSPGPAISDGVIKDKIFQAAEPLHIDCSNAGMELYLHDRTLFTF